MLDLWVMIEVLLIFATGLIVGASIGTAYQHGAIIDYLRDYYRDYYSRLAEVRIHEHTQSLIKQISNYGTSLDLSECAVTRADHRAGQGEQLITGASAGACVGSHKSSARIHCTTEVRQLRRRGGRK